MNRVFYGIIYGLSLLPMRVLYVFADFLFFVLNYIIGYRRKVIYNNLKNAFPEKSHQEIQLIQKKFYRNFADYLLETLKCFSMTQKELDQRHTYSNLEVFKNIHDEKKDIILMAGHVFNWEYFVGLAGHAKRYQTYAVYHKVKNDFWNEQINAIRGKFGTVPLDMKATARFMMGSSNKGENAYLFVADQSPKRNNIQHSIQFLNQETPVFIGFDKIASKKDMAVVYCDTKIVKRGHYHTHFERISPKGAQFEPLEVVDQFFEKLEKTIQKNPDNWLWSHKRWKFKKGVDY